MGKRVKYFIYNQIHEKLSSLSEWIRDIGDRFAICPNCGKNRYTGEPCFGEHNEGENQDAR